MLDTLTDKFSGIFRGLAGRGRISEENVREALRDVRTALLVPHGPGWERRIG